MPQPQAKGKGPTSEMEALNHRFRPALLAFFLRRVENAAEAQDLTQEVFLRLVNVDRRTVDSTEAFIFQIASNLLRDRHRRDRVRSEHQASVLAEEDAGLDVLDPSRHAASSQSLQQLLDALKELPEIVRSIFILYRIEHMDKREIARGFQISASTVDRQLARAMQHLTERLRAGE